MFWRKKMKFPCQFPAPSMSGTKLFLRWRMAVDHIAAACKYYWNYFPESCVSNRQAELHFLAGQWSADKDAGHGLTASPAQTPSGAPTANGFRFLDSLREHILFGDSLAERQTRLYLHLFTIIVVCSGNSLQYPCLGNLQDRRAWWAAVHGSQRVGQHWACPTGHDLLLGYFRTQNSLQSDTCWVFLWWPWEVDSLLWCPPSIALESCPYLCCDFLKALRPLSEDQPFP